MARIFNTFGPRMHMNDGRVVSNFILQALQGEEITVRGILNPFLMSTLRIVSHIEIRSSFCIYLQNCFILKSGETS